MTRTIRLRRWQKEALERFTGSGQRDFQWAQAAAAFGLHLDPAWSTADGRLPTDMHGIVTTYQQVATSAEALARLSAGAMVVFDELHHAADDRAWGAAIRRAFEPAARRLAFSGTPFRSDTHAIPFLTYELDVARPDYEYGYGEALAQGGVVRPIFFPRTNGHMEWNAPDGSQHAATFDDPSATARANQRLRTALSLDGDWLPSVLRAANDRLSQIRRTHPGAGGLVIATDQDHARGSPPRRRCTDRPFPQLLIRSRGSPTSTTLSSPSTSRGCRRWVRHRTRTAPCSPPGRAQAAPVRTQRRAGRGPGSTDRMGPRPGEAELNRLAGIHRVTEATVEQLERRLRQAQHWYTRVTTGGRPA